MQSSNFLIYYRVEIRFIRREQTKALQYVK